MQLGTLTAQIVDYIGVVGGFLLAVCALPLVVEVVRKRNAAGIPPMFVGVWLAGEIFLLVFGGYHNLLPIIINTAFNIIALLIIIYFKVHNVEKGKQ